MIKSLIDILRKVPKAILIILGVLHLILWIYVVIEESWGILFFWLILVVIAAPFYGIYYITKKILNLSKKDNKPKQNI